MHKRPSCLLRSGILFLCGLFLCSSRAYTQGEEVEPGHSIGKVSTNGDLIVMELDEGALGKANQFERCTSLQSVRAIASRMRPCTGIRSSDQKTPVQK
jgi:hypothetical protein